jgi:DNA-binding winged helix-turn-helix (wHTH) protein/tetratricopeptide (TPR) repeat protein
MNQTTSTDVHRAAGEATLRIRAGACEIDLAARELRRDGRRCAVEPRVFTLLAYLAQRPDRVVTRQELLHGVWPGQQVSDAALARAVMKARQALGDIGDSSPIRTVPRVGYRFVGKPADVAEATAPPARRVAILPLENTTGDGNLDWVGLGLMSLMGEAVGREPGLSMVSVASLLTALDGARATGADPAASVRAATGAEWIVRGQVARVPAGYRLTLACPGLGSLDVDAETPGELGPLGARALASLLRPGTDRPLAVPHEANPLATTAFARALQAMAKQKLEPAIHLLRMADMLSPGSTPVRLELLRALCSLGDLAAARPIARGLLAEAQRRSDNVLTGRVHLALALAHIFAQAFEPGIDHLEQCLHWLGPDGPPEDVARAQLMRAQAALYTGDHAGCELALERMRQPCEASGNRLLLVSRGKVQAFVARARGDRERAAELTLALLPAARELHVAGGLMGAVAVDHVFVGRWNEAAAQAEEAFASAVSSKDRIQIVMAVCTGAWTYMVLGVPAAAQRLVEALPPDDGLSSLEQLWAACARGYAAASAGLHAQAIGQFNQALWQPRARGNRMNEAEVVPWLLRSLVLSGRLDEAAAELSVAQPLVGAAAQGALHHGGALLAHARGEGEPALQLLRRVMEDPMATPLWHAWAVLDAAWLLAEAGRGDEALATFEHLPPRFATMPLASAAAARVRFALGDVDAARRCHREYMAAARHGPAPGYFESMAAFLAVGVSIPPAPTLPSAL